MAAKIPCVAAMFTSYMNAHAAVQNLNQRGYRDLQVTYVEGPVDGGLPTAVAIAGNNRYDNLGDRLEMIGIPDDYSSAYSSALYAGQVLVVINGHELPAVMSELSGYATSVRMFYD